MSQSNFRGSFMILLQVSWVKVLMNRKLWLEIRMLSKSMLNKYNDIQIH